MKRRIGIGGALALGLSAVLATPAQAADTETIYVPDDFVQALSSTKGTGSWELEGSSLHLKTVTGTDKVAEYVATDQSLAAIGEPALDYTSATGAAPGFQLIIDFDANGSPDGILIGEPGAYGNDWWLNNAAAGFVKEKAPSHTSGFGSTNHGTLDQWRDAFTDANVTAFGFSLGTGPTGEGVLNAIDFAGSRYTFAAHTVLEGKDDCKKGGWATSTKPEFPNQGQCVSYFAKMEKMK
ncbi:hypothetical protein [Geodermatophilus sabuli]|uniref:Uncharacterized protein n=1 Tax=Geodermatophilus sabuli TaxID=1564158 RepID=A0A285E949_9ACTN|nr:hypothetical protein [Geodermatophilus sabuli]MBB3085102.1 hypothetical protein [Geodermatophilus sabuli]SNX95490.1 hypothetical protein SAMN06893097_102190 [Geodermatophilus sabuli]